MEMVQFVVIKRKSVLAVLMRGSKRKVVLRCCGHIFSSIVCLQR